MSNIDRQNTDLIVPATELIDRLGHDAVAYMHDRIAKLSDGGDDRELDQAYRLLTVVERLLNLEG